MNDESLKELERIFKLYLVLYDSVNYSCNEGCKGYYQAELSEIIKEKFTKFMNTVDKDFVNCI